MTAEAVTLGEVNRNVQAMRNDFVALREGLADRPDWKDMQRVEAGLDQRRIAAANVMSAQHAAVEARTTKLEGTMTWAMRLVVGSVATAAIAAVFSFTRIA